MDESKRNRYKSLLESTVSDCKHMGAQFSELDTLVLLHHGSIIEVWQFLERIHGDQDVASVCLQNQDRPEKP